MKGLQCLIASIAEQRLYLLHSDVDTMRLEIEHWSISSAKNGVGQRKNSHQTPLGWHLVRAKIGADMPIYTVFKGRRPNGERCNLATADADSDWILTRILWLSGMQKGVNRLGHCDSMQRYIYIHGTNQESQLGTAVSHGCLRMANASMIELFDQIAIGCPLLITEQTIDKVFADFNRQIGWIDAGYHRQIDNLNQMFTVKNLRNLSGRLPVLC